MARPRKNAKEIAQETVKAVKEMEEKVEKTAEKVSETVKEKIEKDPVVAETVKDVKEKATAAVEETKAAAKKTVQKAATTAKRVTKPLVKEAYIQYLGKEISQSDIVEMVVAAYISEGHKKTQIKEIELYIKPEDNAAYYVINGTDTGKVYL